MMALWTPISMACLTLVSWLAVGSTLSAQSSSSADEEVQVLTYSDPVTTRWKIGVNIVGGSSRATNILMTLPVPNDWPEQRVRILKEDIPPHIVDVSERKLESGVRQMVIKMPAINAQQEVEVALVLEVETLAISNPTNLDGLIIPKSSHRQGRLHVGVSPQVNHKNSKLRNFVRELTQDEPSAFKKAELIYDWVRDNIDHEAGRVKNALATFEDRKGNNEDQVFLFVAMCRSAKIPARIVFVQGTSYAEFMLTDKKQKAAYWFPCNIHGLREFGEYTQPRIVLQKGDNIKVPEKKERQKFVAEFLYCQGKSRPKVKFIRELLPEGADQ